MKKKSLTIRNKLGIHARAATKIVDTARRYECKIDLKFRETIINGKSIMSVITIGAQKDDIIIVIAEGKDELEAVAALANLVHNKFGEE